MRLRRGLLATAVAAVVLLAGTARAFGAVGGTIVQVGAAPWTVLISQGSAWGVQHCGGSIVDAVHVVTAAHCAYDPTGTEMPANAFSVRAGVSNASSPAAGDAEQDRAVADVRVYPGYVWTGGASVNDVAVLTLASPLVLGGPVQTIALPAAGAPFPGGAQVQVAGYGRQSATSPADGSLRQISLTVESQSACAAVAATLLPSVGTALCAAGAGSSICAGDSGSGLVSAGGSPVLTGIVSAGPASCAPGGDGIFTWVGAPEILSFIGIAPPARPLAQPAPTPRHTAAPRRKTRRPRVLLHLLLPKT